MTPRAVRLVRLGAVAVLCLFVGRWSADFLAMRWWAAAISPEAERFVTGWALRGITLDLLAATIASAWFAAQGLLVARAITGVQVEHRVGDAAVREPIRTRTLILLAIVLGVVLGLVTGAGARAWRAPLALAWQGVPYGATDPLLDRDLGVYVALLPAWDLAQGFALLLAVLGLLLAASLYLAIGAIRRVDGRVVLHADARRHLGGLLAILAVVLAAGAFLTPYHLAASSDPPLGLLPSRTRILASRALAGAAIGVAVMSAAWALRARHSLVLAGWMVLGFGAAVERFLIPAFAAEASGSPTREADLRTLQGHLWGLKPREAAAPDSAPDPTALWDPVTLARVVGRPGLEPLAVSPGEPWLADSVVPTWLVAAAARGETSRLDVQRFRDGAMRDGSAELLERVTITDPRSLIGAPGWRPVAGTGGVPAGGWLKRVTLAWARQAPTMLRAAPTTALDWHLDPVERSRALLPMLSWRLGGITTAAGEPAWLVNGYALVGRAPLMRRVPWGGTEAAVVVPAVVGIVAVASGQVTLFQDPAGGPLADAWRRIAGGLIRPADQMPIALRNGLPYPEEWLAAQLAVLDGGEWGLGRRPGRRVADGPPEEPAVVWDGTEPRWQALYEDPARRLPAALVTAHRLEGLPVVEVARVEAVAATDGRELERRWARGVQLSRLRDSVRASGDSMLTGPIRWRWSSAGLEAWTVHVTEGRRTPPVALWIATARGGTLGGGRTVAEAWGSLAEERTPGARPADPDARDRLQVIREWVARADSALARGDLTAFGRAWEALRGLLTALQEP